MFESPSDRRTRDAYRRAHNVRGAALAKILRRLVPLAR
jgi:hypothetical protein